MTTSHLDDDSSKMAISYANTLPTDHSQTLPSFREVCIPSYISCFPQGNRKTDRSSFFLLTSTLKSILPPTSPLPVNALASSSPVVNLYNHLPRCRWMTPLETILSLLSVVQILGIIPLSLPGFPGMARPSHLVRLPGMRQPPRVALAPFSPRSGICTLFQTAAWPRARHSQMGDRHRDQTRFCLITVLRRWMHVGHGIVAMETLPRTWGLADQRLWCTTTPLLMVIQWPTPATPSSTHRSWYHTRSRTLASWATRPTPGTGAGGVTFPSLWLISFGLGSMIIWIIRIPVRRISRCSWREQGCLSVR